MSQIDQIQITFSAEDDRLLLRLSTQDGAEFRFWLTRRYVRALRPLIGTALARQPHIQTQASPLARQELLRFEQERAVGAADFATPYRAEPRQLPLGVQPVVLARMQVTPRSDGGIVLGLAPHRGQGVDLALSPPLLHSFGALLEHALAAAEWDLPAGTAAAAPTAPPAALN